MNARTTAPATIKDGGCAFPQGVAAGDGSVWHSGQMHKTSAGMSLRDYFAGQALVSMRIHEASDNPLYCAQIARTAYACADAMLAERQREGTARAALGTGDGDEEKDHG